MITGRLGCQFCVGGREEAVAPGCGGMTQRGSRTVRPQCDPRLRPHDHLSFLDHVHEFDPNQSILGGAVA
jgi:hypothetical protein